MSRADSPLAGRMIFNVGARRSGTLWLQRVVTAHPDVAAVPSETHLFSHGIAPLLERFQHGAMGSTEVGRVYVERDAIVDAVRDLCDTVFAPMLGGRARLAERTPVHALHVALIAEVYPDAQVVHIIRDGRDVARSIVAQRWGPDGVAEAAREWRTAVEAARAGAPAGRYVEVRYEDLHADPDRELRRLYGELGLAIDDAIMRAALAEAAIERNLDPAQSPVGSGKWRDVFGPDELRAFEDVAGELRAQLGYPQGELPARGRRLRLRRRAEAPTEGAWRGTGEHADEDVGQHVFDHLLEGLRTDAARVGELLDEATRVRVEGEERRGPELLVDAVRDDAAFRGRQVRGDVPAVAPLYTAVLDFELPGGGVARRTVVVLIERGRITDLTLYRSTPTPLEAVTG